MQAGWDAKWSDPQELSQEYGSRQCKLYRRQTAILQQQRSLAARSVCALGKASYCAHASPKASTGDRTGLPDWTRRQHLRPDQDQDHTYRHMTDRQGPLRARAPVVTDACSRLQPG